MSVEHLSDLNREQRHAVEHGVKAGSAKNAGPLLVIAGAGSGKTKTLAHRVAHLIVNGIDPHRILLLTFSRRAAEEMTRRVKRITASSLETGQASSAMVGYLSCDWCPTAPGICASGWPQSVFHNSRPLRRR